MTRHDEQRPVLAAFGQRVRLYRYEAILTQEGLAELSGLHHTYIGGIERGERNPTLWNILKIAEALELDPADLLEELSTVEKKD